MPRMPVKLATSYMLACCNVSSMRPAAFLASSVLLPAFSAQASGSVADAEAAETASPLQEEEATASLVQVEVCAVAGARAAEGFAVAQAVGSVSSQDGSAVALPEDDSAVVLPVDDWVRPEASVSPLQAEACAGAGAPPTEAVGSVLSRDELAVALPEDGSAQVAAPGDSAGLRVDDLILPEASASLLPVEAFAAAQAVGSVASQDGSVVALPADDSVLRVLLDAAGEPAY